MADDDNQAVLDQPEAEQPSQEPAPQAPQDLSEKDQWCHENLNVSRDSFGDAASNNDVQPSESDRGTQGFSPEDFYNQTLEQSGYTIGSDPDLDKCWENFH